MNEPLVSVLISAYNHEKFIEQCLYSIASQTYRNIELIIFNDGSTDNTDMKIRAMEFILQSRFARYIYVSKENEGTAKTLNKALLMAKGKYIMTFASDDVMLPWRIELQVKYLESHPNHGLVYTDGYRIFNEGFIDMYKTYDPAYRFSNHMEFKEGYIPEYFLANIFNKPTPTICVRKECYDKIGPFDESMISEDPDIYIRLAKEFQIGYIKQVLTIHRMHMGNSGSKKEIIIPLFKRVREKYSESDILAPYQRDILLYTLDLFMRASELR